MAKHVPKVIQPHARGRGWTFAQHRARGYQGGDDFEVKIGGAVRSPVTGFARYSKAGGMVIITPTAGGRTIYVREITRPYGAYPRFVSANERIATAGPKWPHYDTTDSQGKRASIMGRIHAYSEYVAEVEKQKKERKLVARYLNTHGFTVKPTKTASTGVRDATYWRGVQRSAGLKASGIVGTRTKAEERRLIKLVTTKPNA